MPPKESQKRHDIIENSRLIVRKRGDQIIIIPVAFYERPTEALYGSIKLTEPLDDPKSTALDHSKRFSTS